MIVRRLLPWEWRELRAHLLRLDPDDRQMRFCAPAGDRYIDTYCDRIDPLRTIALGCLVDGTLRGVAELIRVSDAWPIRAEVALSVERDFQNRGIGGRLLARAFAVARNRLVHSVYMVFLPENEKVRRLLRGCGVTVAQFPTRGDARIALAWSSPGSVFEETSMNTQALMLALLDASRATMGAPRSAP